jgi:hypothetical protein
MRVFARWWERIPGREAAAPGTLAVLGVAGLLGHAGLVGHLLGTTGWIWG